jgi:ribose/xylose/arabinose/galactoside ABC-type transport system permease subunit
MQVKSIPVIDKLKLFINKSKSSWVVFTILIVISIIIGIIGKGFFTIDNLFNILRQVSIVGIVAVGMTFVIISGGFDLSVGSIVAFSGVITSFFVVNGRYPVIISLIAGLAVGLIIGLINGFLISYCKIAPFVATLGMATLIRGLAYVITRGKDVINLSKSFTKIGGGIVLGIPIPVYLYFGVIFVGIIILNFTRTGRYIYAVGGNEKVANLAGIRVNLIKILTYSISGLLAGLAGIILSSRVMAGLPMSGQGYELDAITAAVIGGTSLKGGIGGIGGTIGGMLIIGVMSNGFDIMLVPYYYKQIASGSIMLIAVVIFSVIANRSSEKEI